VDVEGAFGELAQFRVEADEVAGLNLFLFGDLLGANDAVGGGEEHVRSDQ